MGLLAVLHNQVEPLAALCNHLWSGKVVVCVSWKGGVTGWIRDWTGLWAMFLNYSW